MTVRRRLDTELVRRGLVPSRTAAQAAIDAHRVTVGGCDRVASRPGWSAPGDPVGVLGPPARFVGRGGDKLDAALERFGVDVAGRRALDAGASTGGFTDCLLQRGAATVVAVDVGHGQLHPRIRGGPPGRRSASGSTCAPSRRPTSAARSTWWWPTCRSSRCAPCSPALLAVAAPGGRLVLLVKPQFEAGPGGGLPGPRRDPGSGGAPGGPVRASMTCSARRGATIMGWMQSPLRGADGNVELFVHALAPAAGRPRDDVVEGEAIR